MNFKVAATCLLLSASASWADSLTEETEDFAKSLYREHKDIRPVRRTKEAVKLYIKNLKESNRSLFTISGPEKKLLDKRKNVVKDEAFAKAIDDLKKQNSKDKEIQFLVTYAESKKLKSYKQLFVYRLALAKTKKAVADLKIKRNTDLKDLRKIFVAKKEELGRNPTLLDLALPANLAQFDDVLGGKMIDWIYLGDKNLKDSSTYIIFAEPIALPNGNVRFVSENGSVGTNRSLKVIQEAAIQPAAKLPSDKAETPDTTEAPNKATPKDAVPDATPDTPPAVAEVAKVAVVDPQYYLILKGGAHQIITSHKAYLKNVEKNGLKPKANDISVLNFKGGQEKYRTPDNQANALWVYLGATHKIIKDGRRVICVTSTPVKGTRHLGYFEDESSIEISAEQFSVIFNEAVE